MKLRVLVVASLLILAGCAASTGVITASGSQVELRQIQTRDYDTLDKRGTLRAVVATLQDLGFVIDKADYDLATISATKLQDYEIRMTVTVREREGSRLAVRANARFSCSSCSGSEVRISRPKAAAATSCSYRESRCTSFRCIFSMTRSTRRFSVPASRPLAEAHKVAAARICWAIGRSARPTW